MRYTFSLMLWPDIIQRGITSDVIIIGRSVTQSVRGWAHSYTGGHSEIFGVHYVIFVGCCKIGIRMDEIWMAKRYLGMFFGWVGFGDVVRFF